MIENIKRIENEIELLKQNNEMNLLINPIRNKNEFYVYITFPNSIFQQKFFTEDIEMLLIYSLYNFSLPKLFCLTNFCFPNLNDFRDILENLYDQVNYNIVDIIHSIPNFLINYFSDGEYIFIGRYYLGYTYDFDIMNSTSLNLKKVRENVCINGKWIKYSRYLFLSDIYFLLFEFGKENKHKLVFWASVNSINSIKNILINNIIIIYWKNREGIYEMSLSCDNGEEIVDKLLEKLKLFGIKYNMKKQIIGEMKNNENINKKEEKEDIKEENKKNEIDIIKQEENKNI